VRHIETIRGGYLVDSVFCAAAIPPWLRIALAALSAAGLSAASIRPADAQVAQPPPVDAATLHRLGFYTAGGATISDDGYAQLFVALMCPAARPTRPWIDALSRESGASMSVISLLAIITQPSAFRSSIRLSPRRINLNPLDFSKTASGFLGFGTDCHLKVDIVKYYSPIYYVRKTHGAQFTITPTYEVTDALNATIQNNLNALVSATSTLAGVPAAAAAPYLAALKTNLAGAKTDSTDTFIQHPVIASGPVQPVLTWTVDNAIKAMKTTPAQKIRADRAAFAGGDDHPGAG